ncbi:MAG: insulinase family protein, partial [Elusimicrobiota bacterium]|nr:insulinase family protein [Elusimicrobiota bacterium]
VKLPEIVLEHREVSKRKKFEQSYLMYGFIVPEISSADYTKLKLLNAYLGGGMSSLLFQELREKAGLGYEVNSFYPSRKDKSHFVLYIGLDSAAMKVAEEKIDSVIDKLKTELISDVRLKEIKNYLTGNYIFGHQTNSQQSWYLGWWEILGKGYEYDDRYLKELNKVTPEEIRKVANKYLTDKFVVARILSE